MNKNKQQRTTTPLITDHHPPTLATPLPLPPTQVSPKKGKVIMFYSLLPNGMGDRFSLHGACPVEGKRPKWAANKWVWSSEISFGPGA